MLEVKNLPASAGDAEDDTGLIPLLGRSSGKGNGILLQYYCLGNPMDQGTWQVTVHGVTKSWIQWSTTQQHMHQKFMWFIVLQYLLYCIDLELKLQFLWGMPVLFIFIGLVFLFIPSDVPRDVLLVKIYKYIAIICAVISCWSSCKLNKMTVCTEYLAIFIFS